MTVEVRPARPSCDENPSKARDTVKAESLFFILPHVLHGGFLLPRVISRLPSPPSHAFLSPTARFLFQTAMQYLKQLNAAPSGRGATDEILIHQLAACQDVLKGHA